jgi:hypothetical protein
MKYETFLFHILTHEWIRYHVSLYYTLSEYMYVCVSEWGWVLFIEFHLTLCLSSYFYTAQNFILVLSACIPPGVKGPLLFVLSWCLTFYSGSPRRRLWKRKLNLPVEMRGSQREKDEPALWNAKFHMNSHQNYNFMVHLFNVCREVNVLGRRYSSLLLLLKSQYFAEKLVMM